MSFRAMFGGGRCGICDGSIAVGELVTYVDDELCHEECAAEEEAGHGD